MNQLLRAVVPVIPVKLQRPPVVAHRVFVALRSAADQPLVGQFLNLIGIEGDIRREAGRQAGRQFSLRLHIIQEGRHVPRPPFAGGVQADAHQLMVHKGIVEPVLHRPREVFQILFVQRQRRDHFVVEHLVHIAQDDVVLHAVPHDIVSGQISARHKTGMRAVQDAHLPLFVRRHVRHHNHRHAGLFKGKAVFQPCRPLDDPDAEHLAHVCQRILVSVGRRQRLRLLRVADPPRHDPVHQRGAEDILLVHPPAEILAQLPVVNVLVHAFQQFLPVVVDQFAAEHHNALPPRGKAFVQNPRQFGGKADRRGLVKRALRVVHNARFRGVAHDDLQLFSPGQLQRLVPLAVGIDAPADRGDDALVVHPFALFASPQIQRVQAFLFVDQLRQPLGNGLHQHNLAVESGLFVGNVDKVVHEGAQKVAFAELHHFFGRRFQNIAVITCLFQHFVIQLFHPLILRYGLFILNLHWIAHSRQGTEKPRFGD